jgi:hypothetical protein
MTVLQLYFLSPAVSRLDLLLLLCDLVAFRWRQQCWCLPRLALSPSSISVARTTRTRTCSPMGKVVGASAFRNCAISDLHFCK